MTVIPVRQNDLEYQKLLKTDGPTRHKELSDTALKALPKSIVIVTGNKTKEFGGGPSPDGFVMNGAQMLGRLRIEGKTRNGALSII
jgi:hypothetical protein